MATIPTLTYPESDESVIRHLLTSPLPASADLFEVTDRCAALVTVLLETKEIAARLAFMRTAVACAHPTGATV